jgi:hypothetical protein
MTLDIESLTLGQIRAIQALAFGVPAAASPPPIVAYPYHVGLAVFVRTVTYHYTGRISAIYPGEIVLADAALDAERAAVVAFLRENEGYVRDAAWEILSAAGDCIERGEHRRGEGA